MIEFSLSRKREKVFPETVEVEGRTFFINTDYRVILKIMRMYADPEITDADKAALACDWFYSGEQPVDGLSGLAAFLGGQDERANSRQEMCFEFDAPEIYASFLQQYGIDLVDVPYMHWRKFVMLLSGLGEDTAFRRKMRLRFMDTHDCKNRAELDAAKAAVQIPTKHSITERMLVERLNAALMNGGDITAILGGEKSEL